MKYHVLRSATLLFADGDRVELIPGINTYPAKVREHWAFSAHAKAINEDELKQVQDGEDLELKVSGLEFTITGLQQQLNDKDGTITGLQQQLNELTEKLTAQETANAKKQSSSNK